MDGRSPSFKKHNRLTPKKIRELELSRIERRRKGIVWDEELMDSFVNFFRDKTLISKKEPLYARYLKVKAYSLNIHPYLINASVLFSVGFTPYFTDSPGFPNRVQPYSQIYDSWEDDYPPPSYIELRFSENPLEPPKVFEQSDSENYAFNWTEEYKKREPDLSQFHKEIYQGIIRQWKIWKKRQEF